MVGVAFICCTFVAKIKCHFLQATDFKTPSGNKFNHDNWGRAGFATERKNNVTPCVLLQTKVN